MTKYFDFWSWFLIDEKSFNKSFNASADHFQFTLHHVGLWTFGCHSDRSLEITIEFGCHSLKNFWPIESLLHNTVVAVCSTLQFKCFVKLHSHFITNWGKVEMLIWYLCFDRIRGLYFNCNQACRHLWGYGYWSRPRFGRY